MKINLNLYIIFENQIFLISSNYFIYIQLTKYFIIIFNIE